ncbi:MAG: hypothetical protein JWM43_2439 [Acidobacteriaceae bacterium]|nr:hypothetical protein [Acidobacteriaceae bacterium]
MFVASGNQGLEEGKNIVSDDRIIFLLTLVFLPLIIAAIVFLVTDHGEASSTNDRVRATEERMQRQRTKAYEVAVLLTVGASIASILG